MDLWTGIWIAVVITAIAVGIQTAAKKGLLPKMTKLKWRKASASPVSPAAPREKNWFEKNWVSIAVTTAIVVLVIIGTKKAYNWSAERVAEGERKIFIAAAQAQYEEQAKLNLARALRSAVVIPPRDTTFVVIATKGSPKYLPPRGYCTRRRPVNPSHAFVVITNKGRFIDMPNTDTDLGEIQYFSLEAYGGDSTAVEVEVSKLLHGQCKPPKRDSA